jgi:hypothetical protein
MIMGVLTVLLVAGCTSPFSPGGGDSPLGQNGAGSSGDGSGGGGASGPFGILRIDNISPGGDGIAIATVFPSVNPSDITHYRITVQNGPEDAPEQQQVVTTDGSGGLSAPVEFIDLVPGEWTVVVEGFNGDPAAGGTQLLSGSSSVTILAGQTATVDVPVALISDAAVDGTWSLRVEWPVQTDPDYATTDVVTEVRYSTDGGSSWTIAGSEADASILTDAGNRYVEMGGTRSPGTFFLTVELLADKPEPYDTVARYDEAWHVFGNTTTSRTLSLTEADFSYGGGVGVTVTIDIPEELPGFFDGTPDSTVAAGSDFTITANVAGATAYQWRVDGTPQGGATGETFTLSTAAEEVGVVRAITLSVTVDGMVYSGTHRVRIVAP